MIVALQTAALLAACCGLLGVVRAIPDARLRTIAAAGLILRALGGATLFLISYFSLPVFESLQLGDGFWFYALDGTSYYRTAAEAARNGVDGILGLDRAGSSVTYTQVLSSAILLFGWTPAAGILVNVAAFLGCAWLIGRWGGSGRGAALALAAIAFSPTGILWSTQPLKDSLFIFLVVAYLYALELWKRFWISNAVPESLLLSIVLVATTMFALAGIRWYYAFIAWGASALFFVHVAALARGRHMATALLIGFTAFVLSANAIVASAESYLSATSRRWIEPFVPDVAAPAEVPGLQAEVATVRRGFEAVPGATEIRSGSSTPVAKAIAGAIAATLPRAIANATPLVHIGGEGRGLWFVAEIDTLFFDAVLLVALMSMMRDRRQLADPVVAQFVVLTLAVGLPLVYVVNNFGTLIRLREMIFIGLALIPLALRSARPSARSRSASASAPHREARTDA